MHVRAHVGGGIASRSRKAHEPACRSRHGFLLKPSKSWDRSRDRSYRCFYAVAIPLRASGVAKRESIHGRLRDPGVLNFAAFFT